MRENVSDRKSAQRLPVMSFEQVTMRATTGIVEILKDLTFTIAVGDFVALVGPSGSGKTSLLRLMNRLAEASAGQITLEGTDIHRLPVVSLRRQVVLVSQESRLLGMTVKEALGYPLRLRKESVATIDDAVAMWAEKLKIPTDWMERTTVNLSLGQRQRVAIARALIAKPKLLLLDEPTSAQDVGYSDFLMERLRDWTRQQQLAVVMANHQIELFPGRATHLLHIEGGQLVSNQPAGEVDWEGLRQSLVAAEQKAQAEWS